MLTYEKAVAKYGPPDKETVVNGRRVSVWNVGSTTRRRAFGARRPSPSLLLPTHGSCRRY